MPNKPHSALTSRVPPSASHRVRHAAARQRNLPLLLALAFITIAPRTACAQPEPPTVRISVFSLFHPRTLILVPSSVLQITLDGSSMILDPQHPATFRADPSGLRVELPGRPPAIIHTLTTAPSTFTLAVPGKLTRTFRGALTLTSLGGTLLPIITMDTETAVASIVAAESPPGAALEALKAQAVASRSFLLANPKAHPGADACDTTHCQFLRSPPSPASPAARATAATRGIVLTFRAAPDAPSRIVAAMYSRSCGGHTHSVPSGPDAYPFPSVRCAFCLRHAERWSRPAATLGSRSEHDRMVWNRTHGWSAIPSNTYTRSDSVLRGRGTGHGIGLCQLGASDLAARGATYTQILSHYFPNTALSRLP